MASMLYLSRKGRKVTHYKNFISVERALIGVLIRWKTQAIKTAKSGEGPTHRKF